VALGDEEGMARRDREAVADHPEVISLMADPIGIQVAERTGRWRRHGRRYSLSGSIGRVYQSARNSDAFCLVLTGYRVVTTPVCRLRKGLGTSTKSIGG